eukprot:TRINITY_DN26179_c0_g1_i2.p1 TRINITY_DN26179_c0_g1~~TRINITY_DN26179_c0_g1_i2.p1  ORF type:complete len:440 (+),score=109.02 TRINITY_DN26179_c0_g1_i2:80-1321(+)
MRALRRRGGAARRGGKRRCSSALGAAEQQPPALLNHGALGPGCPAAVLRARHELEVAIERRPYHWYRRELRPAMRRVRAAAAHWLQGDCMAGPTSPAELAFYSCASAALKDALEGAAAASAPGAQVVTLEVGYHSVRQYAAHCFGSRSVTVPVALPLDPAQLEEQLAAAVGAAAARPGGVGAVVLCRRVAPGACVIADGAHAPGHVAPLHDPALVDCYVGNFHKWGFAPKTAAYLWSPRGGPHRTASAAAAAAGAPAMLSSSETRGEYDEWTRDYTPFLVLPECFAHHRALAAAGAFARLRELATEGERLLQRAWGTAPVAPPAHCAPRLRTVQLPPLPQLPPPGAAPSEQLRSQRSAGAAWLHDHLLDRGIEAPIFAYRGSLYARVSVADGNTLGDFVRLGDAVTRLASGAI